MDGPEDRHGPPEDGVDDHPRGTMLLTLLFLMLIVAMWGYIYMLMLGRG